MEVGEKPKLTPRTEQLISKIQDPKLRKRLSFAGYRPSDLTEGFWQGLVLEVLDLEKRIGGKDA